ncbi:MAG: hypothetical protein LBP62_05065 [Clostridiales bacterium]|jgi:hypothetical protein|nr:hypothetical protein [Clostridiales bacterium]
MVEAAVIAGLLSGIIWMFGDIFLVGFAPDANKYTDYLKNLPVKEKKFAYYMLEGSVKRFRAGALCGFFGAPFMLFSLYSQYALSVPSFWSAAALVLLGAGFTLSPPAHIAFYYVGVESKNLYETYKSGEKISADAVGTFDEYVKFLFITWFSAIGATASGWIIFSVLIFAGQTEMPWFFGFFTPIFIVPALAVLRKYTKIGSPYLDGAGFNVAFILFFIAVLIFISVS